MRPFGSLPCSVEDCAAGRGQRLRDDLLAIARMNGRVLVAVKHNDRNTFDVACCRCSRGAALHRCQCRRQILRRCNTDRAGGRSLPGGSARAGDADVADGRLDVPALPRRSSQSEALLRANEHWKRSRRVSVMTGAHERTRASTSTTTRKAAPIRMPHRFAVCSSAMELRRGSSQRSTPMCCEWRHEPDRARIRASRSPTTAETAPQTTLAASITGARPGRSLSGGGMIPTAGATKP